MREQPSRTAVYGIFQMRNGHLRLYTQVSGEQTVSIDTERSGILVYVAQGALKQKEYHG